MAQACRLQFKSSSLGFVERLRSSNGATFFFSLGMALFSRSFPRWCTMT